MNNVVYKEGDYVTWGRIVKGMTRAARELRKELISQFGRGPFKVLSVRPTSTKKVCANGGSERENLGCTQMIILNLGDKPKEFNPIFFKPVLI